MEVMLPVQEQEPDTIQVNLDAVFGLFFETPIHRLEAVGFAAMLSPKPPIDRMTDAMLGAIEAEQRGLNYINYPDLIGRFDRAYKLASEEYKLEFPRRSPFLAIKHIGRQLRSITKQMGTDPADGIDDWRSNVDTSLVHPLDWLKVLENVRIYRRNAINDIAHYQVMYIFADYFAKQEPDKGYDEAWQLYLKELSEKADQVINELIANYRVTPMASFQFMRDAKSATAEFFEGAPKK